MTDGKTTETEFDYLLTTKLLLGVADESVDEILNLYIDITKQAILNYCNISVLPSDLNYVVCEMSADSYRENISKNKSGSVVGNVSSISEDGRTVGFTNGSEIRASINDRITRNDELKRYRKLYRI